MEGPQFAHIEIYSAEGRSVGSPDEFFGKRKNGQKAWTAQEIIDELERLDHASQHVIPGRPGPEIIQGDVDNFVDLRAAQKMAAAAKLMVSYPQSDGSVKVRERKLRADTASIYASVVSLPVRTEEALSDPAVRARAVTVLRKAIKHDRERIEKVGGRFMMAVLIFQRQFQLRRIELFRLRPELRAPVILNLTFQLGEQRLQLGDEGVLLGPNRLLMLPCGALHRGLEPGRFQRRLLGGKGLHHLGRQVRTLNIWADLMMCICGH